MKFIKKDQIAKLVGVALMGAALASCASGSVAGKNGVGAGYGTDGVYASGAGGRGGFVDVAPMQTAVICANSIQFISNTLAMKFMLGAYVQSI